MSSPFRRRPRLAALAWTGVVIYSAFIFYLSSQSYLPHPLKDVPFEDKFMHTGAYSIWGLLFSLALAATWPGLRPGLTLLLAVLAGVLYGASDEYHQSFVPNRTCDLNDLGADTLGSFLGAGLHALWRYRNWARRRQAPGGESPRS